MTSPHSDVERGQLRQEAAQWFARMRGPEADRHRAEFDRWLARGALHRAAYNRIGEIFAQGKRLRHQQRSRLHVVYHGVLAIAIIVLAGFLVGTLADGEPRSGPSSAATGRFISAPGEIRRFVLHDGSMATLDGDTLLATSFDEDRRSIELVRGRARFEVRHETRAFVVAAGDTRVLATGTAFDVAFRRGHPTAVSLLSGSIEVTSRQRDGALGERRTLKLGRPGQTVIDGKLTARPSRVLPSADWTRGPLTFDRTSLAAVVAHANRSNDRKIELGDPEVARFTVSGTFRIDDADLLAERIAALFALDVDRGSPGRIVLRRRTT